MVTGYNSILGFFFFVTPNILHYLSQFPEQIPRSFSWRLKASSGDILHGGTGRERATAVGEVNDGAKKVCWQVEGDAGSALGEGERREASWDNARKPKVIPAPQTESKGSWE